MKKFKSESQRVLDIMINSIYTNKEIFLREILSNASDALDKLYYKSLTESLGLAKEDFYIQITADEKSRTLVVSDNGIGMTAAELENNLGVIARSGSLDFKKNAKPQDEIDIIGQFGVGFYSAFMVSDKVEVLSKQYANDKAHLWVSKGSEGYTVTPAEREGHGTTITMTIKADTEEEMYGEFLNEYRIKELVKKYSDYIRYPIKMITSAKPDGKGDEKEEQPEAQTLNSMIPIWKKRKADIEESEYHSFYRDTFYDFEPPAKVLHTSAEGAVNYNAVLFIPSKAPINYYSKGYEKGLKLYNNGIMIMEKCAELLPDYFSFVKGVVDSDLTLNISRETIQQNHQLKKIASNIEKKIKTALLEMLEDDRENYEKFFSEFGLQLKYGIYDSWGQNKDLLKDLILFRSVNEDKLVTFKEYFDNMKEGQEHIYYAAGKSAAAIKALPQAEKVLDAGWDILCFSDEVDEFAIRFLGSYEEKEFRSVSAADIKEEDAPEQTDKDKEVLDFIKEALGDKVAKVRFSSRLKTHPVCLTSEGELSIGMEKVFNSMPGAKDIAAEKVLEINASHPIYTKLTSLFDSDKDALKDYASILFTQALLIEGLPIDNAAEYSNLVCNWLAF
ncbi:MAG: molecular chaperone HtpG [Clostridia bacterium]